MRSKFFFKIDPGSASGWHNQAIISLVSAILGCMPVRHLVNQKIKTNAAVNSSQYSESVLGIDKGADTIDHILNESLLGETESSLVGDIENAGAGVGVLTVDTTELNVELGTDGLHLFHVLAELGKLDVHGGSESGTKVGRAGSDVTEMVVVGELGLLLDGSAGSAESVEDSLDVGTVLHRDDSKLILLVDPDDESLGVVVEDTSARRPVSVEVASLKESITLPIKFKN